MGWKKITLLSCLASGVIFWLGTDYIMNKGTKPKADGKSNYAIVLGAKVNPGAVPSKSLKNRLDAAAEYTKQYPHVQLIVSGGQGDDEDEAEAVVMRDYLIEQGIEEHRLIVEKKSTSTYENIKFSSQFIPLNQEKITLITNDFHLARAQMIAKHFGFNVDVVAAPTPKTIEFTARARERAGLILQKVKLWR